MIKIGYLSLLPEPNQPAFSGVAKVSETLLRQFETHPDLRVEAFTMINDLPQETVIERGSVRYHYLPCGSRWKTATLFRKEIKQLQDRLRDCAVDLVHGQPTILYLAAATKSGLPNVITIHGLMMRETAGIAKWNPFYAQNMIWETLQRRCLKRAQHIISISPYVDEYVKGRIRGRLWSIANPIDGEFFEIPLPQPDGLRLICVGTVSPRKNQILLVQACRLMAELGIQFQCRIIGEILPEMGARIGEMIAEAGLSNQIVLTDRVQQKDLLEHYRWSNAVVLPSLEETSPLSLIQAMACGRCVFGARAAGIPALLQQGRYGTLFDPQTPQSLFQSLADFVKNPASYWALAEAGRKHASSTFRPSAVAGLTHQLYERIRNSS